MSKPSGWRPVAAGFALAVLFTAVPSARAGETPPASVRLPLADYLALAERAERVERERQVVPEPALSALAAQHVEIRVEGEEARLLASYEVVVVGSPPKPLQLPVTGLVETATIDPAGAAALDLTGSGVVVFYAPAPGRYRLTLGARQQLALHEGVWRLVLAASPAPVVSARLDLPAELSWNAPAATLVGESAAAGRRRVELALPRGAAQTIDLRRQVDSAEAARTIARSVVVTVVETTADALYRRDVVLYEVLRGSLGSFEVGVPAGLEIDAVASDEGEVVPVVEAGRLRAERRRRLAGVGHLTLVARPAPAALEVLALPALEPLVPVRARYLVLASAVAAVHEPQPPAAFQRVDLGDLPAPLQPEIAALAPGAVYRIGEEGGAPQLAVHRLPVVDALGQLVRRRTTTTLLTVEGTLLHRDRFVLADAGSVFELALPEGATLWSVEVEGVGVRPVERGGRLAVPLAFRAQGEVSVEVVAVQNRAVPPGRSRWRLETARVTAPVLAHEWRLLLPEGDAYRYAGGELTPAPITARPAGVRPASPRQARASTGTSSIVGTVRDGKGTLLPGVTVSLELDGRVIDATVSRPDGSFEFAGLAAGRYLLTTDLEGFGRSIAVVNLASGSVARPGVQVDPSAVEEVVIVDSSSELKDSRDDAVRQGLEQQARLERQVALDELGELRQGLVGGVRPIAVAIPETGKLLLLSAALPPERVGVELEVKAKR